MLLAAYERSLCHCYMNLVSDEPSTSAPVAVTKAEITITESVTTPNPTTPNPATTPKLTATSKIVTTFQTKTLAQVSSVFGDGDDDEGVHVAKKRLKPFEITPEERAGTFTAEERKLKVKELIDSIPTSKAELLACPVRWVHVDEALIEQRIRPWVEKKLAEYIGDDEPSLVSFICERVSTQCDPNRLLADLAMVRGREPRQARGSHIPRSLFADPRRRSRVLYDQAMAPHHLPD